MTLEPFERTFDSWINPFFINTWRNDFPEVTSSLGSLVDVNVDVSETDKAYNFDFELPGMKKKDIKVTHDGDTLTIKGETRKKRDEKDMYHHYMERRYGRFLRTFQLPKNANWDSMKAKYDSGLLSVEIPKKEEKKDEPKPIDIE